MQRDKYTTAQLTLGPERPTAPWRPGLPGGPYKINHKKLCNVFNAIFMRRYLTLLTLQMYLKGATIGRTRLRPKPGNSHSVNTMKTVKAQMQQSGWRFCHVQVFLFCFDLLFHTDDFIAERARLCLTFQLQY